MAKFNDECWDSADWIEEITGYRPVDDVITLEELEELSQNLDDLELVDECGYNILANHGDYALSETDMLATDEDKADQEYVLVRFADIYGGYEYGWCEI